MQNFQEHLFLQNTSSGCFSNSFSSKGEDDLMTFVVGNLTTWISIVMINWPTQAAFLFYALIYISHHVISDLFLCFPCFFTALVNYISVTFYVGTLVTCVIWKINILWVKYNKINGIYFLIWSLKLSYLTVCYYHVKYKFQSESILNGLPKC